MRKYTQLQDAATALYSQRARVRFTRCSTRISCEPLFCIFYESSGSRQREDPRLQTRNTPAFAGLRRKISKSPYQRCNMKYFLVNLSIYFLVLFLHRHLLPPSSQPARSPVQRTHEGPTPTVFPCSATQDYGLFP